MPRFVLNKRTMQMEPQLKPRAPTTHELLTKVKRVHAKTIRDHAILDRHLELVIEKIQSGTRNVNYLSLPGVTTDARIREIFYFLLRETIT